jgi:WD40 repeat protein
LYVDGIAISIDGKLVLCKTSDQKVRVWNVTEAKLVMTVEDPLVLEAATDYDRVSFSTDSKTAYSRHRVPRAWEIPSGKLIESCDKLPADRTPIVFSPDGRRCACRGALGSYNLEIFDPSEGKLLQAIVPVGKGPMRQIRVAEFSPNGRRLAVAGEGDLLQIWEIESGKLVQNLRREPGAKPN